MDNYKEALSYYQQSITANINGFALLDFYLNPKLADINYKIQSLSVLGSKAMTLSSYYRFESNDLTDLQASFETYSLAADLIDTLRFEYTTTKTIRELTEKSMPVYEGGISVAHQLYQLTEDANYLHQAFNLAERSKAFLLGQSLKEVAARSFGGVPDSLLEQERDLKIDIAFYEKSYFDAEQKKDSAKSTMYQNYLFERKRQYEELIQKMERDYPRYHRLKYNSNIATVKNIQEKLDVNSLLLDYFSGDDSLFVFAITKKTFSLVPLKKDSLLERHIKELQKGLYGIDFIREAASAYQTYTHHAHALYQKIMAPALAGIAPAEKPHQNNRDSRRMAALYPF